jgi:hypothetical protein
MIANNQSISSLLGVSQLPTVSDSTAPKSITIDQETPGNDKADNDYEFARGNLYGIIENGQRALDDMIDFARQAQHPRAYEVVGTLISNLVDANQKLLNLSKQVKEIKKQDADKDGGDSKTVNNNLFVGSTVELQKLLRGE